METGRLHSILLVEDNPADVKIMQRALAQAASRVDLAVVHDGQEAVDYLLRQGPYAGLEKARALGPDGNGGRTECSVWRRPDLIVLDLNLPRLTGIDVLKMIRAVDHLCLTPVVVLSTSRSPDDVTEAYGAGANTYVEKPTEYDRFVEMLRTILQFWLEIAVLPPTPAG
jgi:CheY-like chemotaxis protein